MSITPEKPRYTPFQGQRTILGKFLLSNSYSASFKHQMNNFRVFLFLVKFPLYFFVIDACSLTDSSVKSYFSQKIVRHI